MSSLAVLIHNMLPHGELFENYTSKENDNVIKEYQNTTGYSTPYTLDGSVLIVNPDLTKGMNIEGYSDLLKPELKRKNCYC